MTAASSVLFDEQPICGTSRRLEGAGKTAGLLALVLMFAACATNLQTKVSGNLNHLSKQQTVAILPVEVMEKGQMETASLFRQTLYANLKQSHFNLLERFVVDGLLQQNNLTDPSQFLNINPMRFAEILGADAVLISRINKVERSYLVVHSSIEIGVSVQMVDTRTGEILWRAEQTESDFQGIGKIPTGISSAILGPIQFVTNKLNLRRMTSKLVNKLTAIVKKPEDAEKKETFDKPVIASAATRDLKKMEEVQNLEAEWAEDVAAYTVLPEFIDEVPPGSADDTASGPDVSKEIRPKLVGYPLGDRRYMEPGKNGPEISPVRWNPRTLQKPGPVGEQTQTDPAPQPTATVSALYTIQVGAYKNRDSAERMVSALAEKGYNAYLLPCSEGGSPLFKVQVEKFSDKERAYDLARKLIQKEHLQNFVTLLPPVNF